MCLLYAGKINTCTGGHGYSEGTVCKCDLAKAYQNSGTTFYIVIVIRHSSYQLLTTMIRKYKIFFKNRDTKYRTDMRVI